MFLIQYNKDAFINAEKIEWISVVDYRLAFGTTPEGNEYYPVHKDFQDVFLNNLQALNGNISDITQLKNETNQSTTTNNT